MIRSPRGPVAQFAADRGAFLEVAFSAIAIGLGVGLLAAGISGFFETALSEDKIFGNLLSGALVTLSASFFLWRLLLRFGPAHIVIKGFYVFDGSKKKLVPVHGYDFANKFEFFLRLSGNDVNVLSQPGIASSAAEYDAVVRLVSVWTRKRADAATRPWTTLACAAIPALSTDGIYRSLATASGGGLLPATFSAPKGTSFVRAGTALEMRTRGCTLRLEANCGRFVYPYPQAKDFIQYFLGQKDAVDSISLRPATLHVRLSLGFWQMLTFRRWEQYDWIDEFLEDVRRDMDAEDYFDGIGRGATLALLRRLDPVISFVHAKQLATTPPAGSAECSVVTDATARDTSPREGTDDVSVSVSAEKSTPPVMDHVAQASSMVPLVCTSGLALIAFGILTQVAFVFAGSVVLVCGVVVWVMELRRT